MQGLNNFTKILNNVTLTANRTCTQVDNNSAIHAGYICWLYYSVVYNFATVFSCEKTVCLLKWQLNEQNRTEQKLNNHKLAA